MCSTACSQACLFAFENDVRALSLRRNCSAEARTSSSVAGGSKWYRVLMFRHMTGVCPKSGIGAGFVFVATSQRGWQPGIGRVVPQTRRYIGEAAPATQAAATGEAQQLYPVPQAGHGQTVHDRHT